MQPVLYTLGALAVVDWDQLEAMTTLTECLPRYYELGEMTLTADCEVDLASAYMIQGDTCAAALHAGALSQPPLKPATLGLNHGCWPPPRSHS